MIANAPRTRSAARPVLKATTRPARPPRRPLLLPRERSLKPALLLMSAVALAAVAYISVHAYATGESYALRNAYRDIQNAREEQGKLLEEKARLESPANLTARAKALKLEVIGPADDVLEPRK